MAKLQKPNFKTFDALESSLDKILCSPADNGTLSAIVTRPERGEREQFESHEISAERGVHGDLWVTDGFVTTDDGQPHPDIQVCIMNSRCIALIEDDPNRWKLAGDNLFVDLDLSEENLVVGQRLSIGTAIIQVSPVRHNACAKFVERYGQDAAKFVSVPKYRNLRLRGIYARVVQDGRVSVGDRITKVK